MNWKQELGSKIEQARNKKGWTQKYLGVQAHFHYNTIGLYERGERAPDFEELHRLAEALGQDHFYVSENIRIDFAPNGRIHPQSIPQQLELQFDEKKGVSIRIESHGQGILIKKLHA